MPPAADRSRTASRRAARPTRPLAATRIASSSGPRCRIACVIACSRSARSGREALGRMRAIPAMPLMMEGCAGVWVSEPSRVALALAGPLLQLAVHAAADPPLPGATAVRAEVRRRPETAELALQLRQLGAQGRVALLHPDQ